MAINASNLILLGGVPCLDYVNTKNWHTEEAHFDFFTDYNTVLRWSLQLDFITQLRAERLYELSRQHAKKAKFVLEQARSFRETTYKIFFAVANGLEVPANELKLFNGTWTKSLENLQVLPDHKAFRWKWVGTDDSLDSILWPVVHSAAELLISEKLNLVKDCDGCGWLFLDTTKGGRRRWCDMRICGNRVKSRRHYARSRTGIVI